MKLLGIDYGTKRIGLAVGDTETKFAFPLRTIQNNESATKNVVAVVVEEGIERVVVGMPRSLSDVKGEGETEARVGQFIVELRKIVGVPVDTEDERFTTAYVERLQKESGGKLKDFDRDAAAAAAILESYIVKM